MRAAAPRADQPGSILLGGHHGGTTGFNVFTSVNCLVAGASATAPSWEYTTDFVMHAALSLTP